MSKLLTKISDIFWPGAGIVRKLLHPRTSFLLPVVISFTLGLPLAHAQTNQCQSLFSADTWDSQSLSNPRNFDNDNFKFLLRATRTHQKLDERPDLAIGTSMPYIFTSLVSTNKLKTFLDGAGIILKFDKSHLIGTSAEDTRTVFVDKVDVPLTPTELENAFARYQERYPIQNPDAILEGTGTNWNNEVVLRGKNSAGRPVEIQAIYVYTDINGKLLKNPQGNELMLLRLAKKFKLPIVKFRAPIKRFDDEPLQPMRDPETEKLTGFSSQRLFERTEFDFTDLETFAKHLRIRGTRVEASEVLYPSADQFGWKEFASLLKSEPSLIKEIESRREELISDPKCGRHCQFFFGEFLSMFKP